MLKMSKKQAGYRIAVRILKPEVSEFLKLDAKQNNRSVSGEINHLVELGMAEVLKEQKLIQSIRDGKSQIQIGKGERNV